MSSTPEGVAVAPTIETVTEGIDVPDGVRRFGHTPGTEIVFGAGVTSRIGTLCAELVAPGAGVLVVTDPGIVTAGHLERVAGTLRAAGLGVATFAEVHENPTTEDVARCVEVARERNVRALVGLGGGSSLDTAKGCNFLLTNGGSMRDYWGVGKAAHPMLPFVAVPTTAGTGSECQSFALIADAVTHQKMACGDRKAAARFAVLDPELTMTQPRAVAAHTGIDAIAHAVETAVTRKRTETSFEYSRVAFRLLDRSFHRILEEPRSLEARADMQLGAAYAGTAIENSMLGAAHSAANPLTARFNVIHGEAVGLMLPHVVRLNRRDPASAAAYDRLAPGIDLADRLEELMVAGGMRLRLRDHGVDEEILPTLAREAADQWTAQFNPVEVGADEFLELFRGAL